MVSLFHHGPPSKERFRVEKRLTMYANKEFSFGTGQKPRKGSQWDKELKRIEECPAHNKLSSTEQRLQFAPRRKATCTCGYHRPVSAMICFFNFAYVATFIIIIIYRYIHCMYVCLWGKVIPPQMFHRQRCLLVLIAVVRIPPCIMQGNDYCSVLHNDHPV